MSTIGLTSEPQTNPLETRVRDDKAQNQRDCRRLAPINCYTTEQCWERNNTITKFWPDLGFIAQTKSYASAATAVSDQLGNADMTGSNFQFRSLANNALKTALFSP